MASEAKVKLVLVGEDRTGPAFKKASTGATGFGTSIKNLLPVLGVAGLVGAIGGVLKATADFEQQLSDVSTLISGDSTDAISELRTGIQELLKETPKTAEELGAAAYSIVSAGISDTNDALKTLKASTMLAVAGLGSTEEATTLLVTAMNAFGKTGDEAGEVSDILFKTVKAGQTNVSQLTQAFGKMAGNAAAAGLSLEDVQAATAAITTVTGKTSEAQNALAQVFLELTVAGGKLDKGLQDQGSSLDDLNRMIQEQGGVVGGFRAMKDELGLTDTQFKNLFSSAEGGTAVYQLLTTAGDAYATTLEDMTTGTNAIGEATDKQKEQFNAQYQMLKNNVNVEFQKLAIEILPALTDIMKFITEEYIPYMIKAFEGLTSILGDVIYKIGLAIDEFKRLAKEGGLGLLKGVGGVLDGIGTGVLKGVGAVTGLESFQQFAEGGVVPGHLGQPQMAMVHGGEQIIPAYKSGRQGGITINLSGTFLSERAADEIGTLLLRRLETQLRF